MQAVSDRVRRFLAENEGARALGWEPGATDWDIGPAVFAGNADGFVYNELCGANLSKFLIKESEKEGKVLVCLKPCDCYSFVQLQNEHRIKRDNIFALGVPCDGMIDLEKIRESGVTAIKGIEVKGDKVLVRSARGDREFAKKDILLEKCLACKGKTCHDCDEVIEGTETLPENDRFAGVEELEAMSPDERFAFWQDALSRCIRCNACRNVCPACSCEKCVFDNDDSGVAAKSNANSFEEQMFHIIRAFHVAGRCTDCGECSRVCPQRIPLHLLNRKFIKDINGYYGDYQAGAELGSRAPLVSYTEGDVEPSVVKEG